MSEPTKRDQTMARKKTEREAARYPLLAAMGLTRTWTAQELADRREELHARALKAAEADRRDWSEDAARAWLELAELAGEEDTGLYRRVLAWSASIGGFMARADDHHVANVLRGAITRVKGGHPLLDSWMRERATV